MALRNLHLASGTPILNALTRLKSTFNTQNAWLGSNRYIIDTSTILGNDIRANTINNADITNYMASSVPIHCFNGWSYLSSAVSSFLEGDCANAIHNAYYAELRAIISFLACQGIGVFNRKNVIIQSNSTVIEVDPPGLRTHDFSKQAFDHWLNNPTNADALLNLLLVDNLTLKQWIDATGFSPSSYMPGQLAASWLQSWSLDLNVIKGEQLFRNFVSYNPQTFDLNFLRQSDNIIDKLSFIDDLWKLCSPSNLFSYSILRNSLEELYKKLFSITLLDLDFESDWKPILIGLGMDPYSAASRYLIKFLRREVETSDNMIFRYAKSINFSNPLLERDTEPMGIISRATLLLLITTEVAKSVLRQSGVNKADLKFWMDNIGIKLGYWDTTNEPYLYSDLWQDIDIELDEIKQWIINSTVSHNPYRFRNDLKQFSHNIRHLNKTYLWGIVA